MSTKNILSTLFILSVLSGPTGVLADSPVVHDHQKSKGTMIRPADKSVDHSEDCLTDGVEKSAEGEDENTPDSKDSKTKCAAKESSSQNHDHRKMKNQP